MAMLRVLPRVHRAPQQERVDKEILLVEDQKALALVAAQMLYERWGCRVLIATTQAQVQTIIKQDKHDFFVAISDICLPDAPNGEVIDTLVASGIPTIAVSGTFDREMLEQFMNKGIIDYVLKSTVNAYEYIVDVVGRLHRNTGIKALIVDDSDGFRHLLAHMLRKQCLQVITASTGREALRLFEAHRDIKLVLIDYLLPGMSGTDLLAEIRRKWRKDKLGVIGISGVEDNYLSAQFLKFGANDYIPKPFTYEELVCRVNHVLQMQESIEALSYIAYHDHLTGLLNRRAFFEAGVRIFENAAREKTALAVAMIDIDFFKRINDRFGHDGGDAVLIHFAGLLKAHFPTDLVGRLGGEEFALVTENPDDAIERCEAFREATRMTPALFENVEIAFTVSIGVTLQKAANLDGTLRLADGNLYKAKQSGRNSVVSS